MAFTPRTTKPEAGNPYFNTIAKGGYSTAIVGSPTDAGCNVLHNCVGYAVGRFNEIGGWGAIKYLRPVNAENFIQYAGDLQIGQEPRVGACMVWRKGPTLSSKDGAGHVAIVEKVIDANTVLTSESGYGAKNAFWTQTRKRGTNGNWGEASSYAFLGFIYNPAPCCGEAPAPTPTGELVKGAVVDFLGGYVYTSSKATFAAGRSAAGQATITNVAQGAAHPYHLVHTNGASNVYGWVDESAIAQPAPAPAPADPAQAETPDPAPAATHYLVTVGPITKGDVPHVLDALTEVAETYQLGDLIKTEAVKE